MAQQTAEKHEVEEVVVGGNKRASKSMPASKAAPAKPKQAVTLSS